MNSGPEGLWLSATCAVCKRRATVSLNEHVDKEIVPSEPIASTGWGNRMRYRDFFLGGRLLSSFVIGCGGTWVRLGLGDRVRALFIFRRRTLRANQRMRPLPLKLMRFPRSPRTIDKMVRRS